jgi:hypothetical protein
MKLEGVGEEGGAGGGSTMISGVLFDEEIEAGAIDGKPEEATEIVSVGA